MKDDLTLRMCPIAAQGNPVELLVANKSFFVSSDDGNPVDTQVVVPFQGFGNVNEVIVKIPDNEFVAQQKFKLSDGAFILFEATGSSALPIVALQSPTLTIKLLYVDQGLRVAQQQVGF
jgi:hypothetical protein